MEQNKTEEKQPDLKLQARENFKNQIKQQAGAAGMPLPQNDFTDEELDIMIKKRTAGLKKTLKQKEVSLKLTETYLARVAADKAVLVNVDLEKAETEWDKKAIQAEADEMQAILEGKQLEFEEEKKTVEPLQKELQKMQELL
jgi:hypothetical protein